MRRLILLALTGLIASAGCGSHRQAVRPGPPVPEPAANDPKNPPRIISGESPTVQNWSTGGP